MARRMLSVLLVELYYTYMTRHCRIFVAVLLNCSLLPVALMAQEQDARSPMTLHDCMEYAVSNSTKMRIQAADRSDERWQHRHAVLSAFTPGFTASTYLYDQFGRNIDPETNTYKNVTSIHNGYSVSASITLFDGFQAVNNVRMSATAMKMGLSQEIQERDKICLATIEAFSNVIYYTEMVNVIESQVESAGIALRRAVRQEELGQKGHADVVQMESELAQKEYLLITNRNERDNAILTLKDIMFWPAGEELLLDTDIEQPACTIVDRAGLTSNAKESLPSAKIASFNVYNASLGLKIARGAYSPSLSLFGGWSTSYYTYPGRVDYSPDPFASQFRNNGGEYLELSLSVPLYSQLRRRTALSQKKNALVRAEAQYDQTMRDIENEVVRAMNDRDGARSAFYQAERLADVQQEAYQLSTKQFELGMISAIEYQTASQTYLNAMAERMNSLLQLRIKDAVVRYYNGEPYIDQY